MLPEPKDVRFSLYVIRDRVAEEYGPPFTSKNDGVAQRKFQSILMEAKNTRPSDFELVHVGYYNPLTAEIELKTHSVVSGG